MGVTCGDWCAGVIPGAGLVLLAAIAVVYYMSVRADRQRTKKKGYVSRPTTPTRKSQWGGKSDVPRELVEPLTTPGSVASGWPPIEGSAPFYPEDYVLLRYEASFEDEYGRLIGIADNLLTMRLEKTGEVKKVLAIQTDFEMPSSATYDAYFTVKPPAQIPDLNPKVKIIAINDDGEFVVTLPDHPAHGAFHVPSGMLRLLKVPELPPDEGRPGTVRSASPSWRPRSQSQGHDRMQDVPGSAQSDLRRSLAP